MPAAGQRMGLYIIYLHTPPAPDANVFPSITGMCVRWGSYFTQRRAFSGCAISADTTASRRW